MSKITQENYTLPIIEALSPHESFESGANKPLLITGADVNGRKGDYVVKFRGAARMSNEACMRELLAAFIAAHLGIRIVSPVIVNISQNFVELLIGNDAWQYANKSLGFNYGSEYIKKYSTILPTQDLNLDENFWETARTLIPDEWLSDQFDRIKQHFSAICNNKDAFIIELKKLMS